MEQRNTLKKNIKTFEEEQNDLFQSLINTNFYDRWLGKISYDKKDIYDTPTLELTITSVCNKACKYCYLVKHGDELYPKEI